jgi:transcriptional regulator with XRE-family HTH domain
MPKSEVNAVFMQRLAKAREALGFSQRELGSRMGLPDETAATRINRYERGGSEPDLRTAQEVADALGVPLSWLVCTDARLAEMIHGFAQLKPSVQRVWLAELKETLKSEENLAKPKVAPVGPRKRAPRVKR